MIPTVLSLLLLGYHQLYGKHDLRHPGNRQDPSFDQLQDLQNYLLRYGYLQPSTSRNSTYITREAIARLQRQAKLPITGEVNNDTLAVINRKRCGTSDLKQILPRRRPKRYVLHDTRWRYMKLTYCVRTYPLSPYTTHKSVDQTVARAFKIWSSVSRVTFIQQSHCDVDIVIQFNSGYHGDPTPFDGVGKVLAHSYYPGDNSRGLHGDLHFDDDEPWTTAKYVPTNREDIFCVAVHEIGHSLGLQHTDVRGSIMWPWVRRCAGYPLGPDDIRGIQAIYGPPQGFRSKATTSRSSIRTTTPAPRRRQRQRRPTIPRAPKPRGKGPKSPFGPRKTNRRPETRNPYLTSIPPTRRSPQYATKQTQRPQITPRRPGQPKRTTSSPQRHPCDGLVDAVMVAADGRIYAFRENLVFEITSDGVAPGYPRPSRDVFIQAPSTVDAAITLEARLFGLWESHTYLFNNGRAFIYRYNQRRDAFILYKAGVSISKHLNIPTSIIDSAFYLRDDGVAYFTRGEQFWRLRVDALGGYTTTQAQPIANLTEIQGIPRFNTAVRLPNSYVYFFNGRNYFRARGQGSRRVVEGPREIARWLFKCSSDRY